MNKTKIEWVKNPDGTQGYTSNPITGCKNHTPEGLCLGGMFPCYAYKLANTRLRGVYCANSNLPTHDEPNHEAHHSDPFYPRFWEERLKELEDRHTHNNRFSKPIGVFPCDMSDLFGIGIPEEWTRRVLDVISKQMTYPAENDHFYLLTKQPQNLIKFSPFPDNCWVGVTATDDNAYTFATHYLEKVEAKVKYISFEPLLTVIDCGKSWDKRLKLAGIKWVIIGAQTKPTVFPKIEWVEEIVRSCDKAGIPVFLKDNLNPLFAENDCKLFTEYRDKLFTFKDFELGEKTRWHLRQEMPG